MIEDDPAVAFTITELLEAEGYRVVVHARGEDALPLLREGRFDAVVIDIGLPDVSGLDLLKALDRNRAYGVILLTGRGETVDIVVGLELGADDYIVKPFEPREFMARVRSVIRRAVGHGGRGVRPASMQFPTWSYDPATRRIRKQGERAEKLTANEARLLEILIDNANRILSREHLLEKLHPRNSDIPFDRSIDVTIARLRRKLEPDGRRPRYIKTARGDGYLFDPHGE